MKSVSVFLLDIYCNMGYNVVYYFFRRCHIMDNAPDGSNRCCCGRLSVTEKKE
ncbi:MAG: hypothetical protein K2J08_04360 [Ruminococcus sp.]|nr:hypothetical protein [Ruminococcus sp.]